MSNEQRKFDVIYTIRAMGISRGWEGEMTFQERFVDDVINAIVSSLGRSFNSLSVTLERQVVSK